MNNAANSGGEGTINRSSDGGVAGEHQPIPAREALVGPTTKSAFNTIRAHLIPFACWGVNDFRFQFGSSFVVPGIEDELQALHALIEKHTTDGAHPPLSVFGHADPIGNDDFNKVLSGRRAQAIYALLTRKTDLWEELFKSPQGGDRWGDDATDIMLARVAESSTDSAANQNQTAPPDRNQRIRDFQSGQGLAVDGIVGPNTRKALFSSYMDALCGDLLVDPAHFLGKGADSKGKADYQGCSEFNPLLIFSKEVQEKFQQPEFRTERDLANAPNRRVMVFLFRSGSEVMMDRWPCPRVGEDTGGCKKRFWSDGEDRRTRREKDTARSQITTDGTFACRFYDRLSNRSPCERILPFFQIRLFDDGGKALPYAPCLVTVPGREPQAMRASGAPANETGNSNQGGGSDPEGPRDQGASITLRDLATPGTVNVKWSRPHPDDGAGSRLPKLTDEFEYELDVVVDIPDGNEEEASLTRLTNMGYVRGPERVHDIKEFQRDYKAKFSDIEIDGTLNMATQNAIKEVHESCDLVEKGQQGGSVEGGSL